MACRDHFSGHAADYAAYRPRYPAELFIWLATIAPRRNLAWDCGTGNGQAALALARSFVRVIASDASPGQLAQAGQHPRVAYRTAPAGRSALPGRCADAVTVAQALHWFDRPRFWAEVRRVLRPGGVVAAWCYGLATIDSAVDVVVAEFYQALAAHWAPERRLVETGYRTIRFPFREIAAPRFAMTATWTAGDFLAYLGTWSAVLNCRAATARDPLAELGPALLRAWPRDERRLVRWPLAMRVGFNE